MCGRSTGLAIQTAREAVQRDTQKDDEYIRAVRKRMEENLRGSITERRLFIRRKNEKHEQKLKKAQEIDRISMQQELSEVVSSYRFHPSRKLLDLELEESRLYECGRYDEMQAVRKLAKQVEEKERRVGRAELNAKLRRMRQTLRQRHQEEMRIAGGRSLMDEKTMNIEIENGREWIEKMIRIAEDNVQQKHHHAELIKAGRCPDVGYKRMVTMGRRYHKEYVSQDSNPIPSVSNEHTFVEPTKKEIKEVQMEATRRAMAQSFSFTKTEQIVGVPTSVRREGTGKREGA